MLKLDVCVKCRKLFTPVFTENRCPQCNEELEQKIFLVENAIYRGLKQTVADIVEYTQLPEEDVILILKSQRYLNETVTREALCSRCHEKQAQAGSEFCVDCRFELYQAINKMAGTIYARVGDRPYKPTSGGQSLQTLMTEVRTQRGRDDADDFKRRHARWK
jgi:predicted amidophosphoribosyltransferase